MTYFIGLPKCPRCGSEPISRTDYVLGVTIRCPNDECKNLGLFTAPLVDPVAAREWMRLCENWKE